MRMLRLLYSVTVYFVFFAVFLYLVGFVGNLFVPVSVDVGPEAPFTTALLINTLLIMLFGVQHSVMARPAFKAWLTKTVHPAIERSTYVLATVIVLLLTYHFWRPMPEVVWATDTQIATMAVWAVFFLGWTILFLATWHINHFELFGLHQAWADFKGGEVPVQKFRDPGLYKVTRHPIYLGVLMAVWAAPTMTQGHLLLAVGWTIYVFIGVHYEEKDLIAHLGDDYREYRKRVGAVIPFLGRSK